jgi:hypothetical protein
MPKLSVVYRSSGPFLRNFVPYITLKINIKAGRALQGFSTGDC